MEMSVGASLPFLQRVYVSAAAAAAELCTGEVGPQLGAIQGTDCDQLGFK